MNVEVKYVIRDEEGNVRAEEIEKICRFNVSAGIMGNKTVSAEEWEDDCSKIWLLNETRLMIAAIEGKTVSEIKIMKLGIKEIK